MFGNSNMNIWADEAENVEIVSSKTGFGNKIENIIWMKRCERNSRQRCYSVNVFLHMKWRHANVCWRTPYIPVFNPYTGKILCIETTLQSLTSFLLNLPRAHVKLEADLLTNLWVTWLLTLNFCACLFLISYMSTVL